MDQWLSHVRQSGDIPAPEQAGGSYSTWTWFGSFQLSLSQNRTLLALSHCCPPSLLSYLSILRWVPVAKGAGDHQDHGLMLQVHNVILVHGHHLGAQRGYREVGAPGLAPVPLGVGTAHPC